MTEYLTKYAKMWFQQSPLLETVSHKHKQIRVPPTKSDLLK